MKTWRSRSEISGSSKLKLLWTLRCDKCDPCLDNSIPNVICNLRYTIDTYWYPVTMSSRHHITGVSYFQTQSLSDLQRLEHSPTSWKPPGGADDAFAIPSKGTKQGAKWCKDIQSDARKCKGYERKEAFKLWKWTRVESRTSTYQPKFGAFFSAKMAILRTSSCTHRTRSERLGRSRHVPVAKLGKFNSSANPRLLIFPPSSPPFFLNQDPSLNRGLRPSLFRHHIFSSFHSSSCITVSLNSATCESQASRLELVFRQRPQSSMSQ